MVTMSKFFIAFVLFFVIHFPAFCQQIEAYPAPRVINLDGNDLYIARFAIENFYRTEQHPECYNVLFSRFHGNLRVDFVPKTDFPVIMEDRQRDREIPPPCGRNVGYIIDSNGRIIRMIYSR